MTAVQQQTIPYIIQGRDVLVKSQTGSGKTLTFAVPIVQALQNINPKIQRIHGPYAIVIVPTREVRIYYEPYAIVIVPTKEVRIYYGPYAIVIVPTRERVQEELSKNPPPVKVSVQVNNGKRLVNATSSSTSTSVLGGPPSSAKKRKNNYGKPQNKSHNSDKSSGKPSGGFKGPKKSGSST
ncbi:DDX31 [Mytilus coruscus]|uniref:ATP-dependent RNA helicase n=1 Tax=Mytilus coruscus TaxID=42192 RepID=A0A6J8ESD4_MYTCO|nr:DDX31 [Mytilus coruscus]